MTIRISASQVSTFLRCPRKYSWKYVEGVKPPSTPRQEFGREIHAILAAWLKDGKPPPKTPAGEVTLQGVCAAGVLPLPRSSCAIEVPFFFPWTTGVVAKVVPDWAGEVDGELLVVDHKTTSDLRWAMTSDQLKVNEQAIIYAAWAMLKYRRPVVRARWIYYAATNPKGGKRRPAGLRPVEVVFDARNPGFLDQIARLDLVIGDMRVIREQGIKPLDLPPSVEACEAYEGCFHRERCGLSDGERLEGYFAKIGNKT